MSNTAPQKLTETEFVEKYGDSTFKRGDLEVTLNQALEMEKMLCPADIEKRENNDLRLSYMAKMVGAEALLPEHQYLLEQTDGVKA